MENICIIVNYVCVNVFMDNKNILLSFSFVSNIKDRFSKFSAKENNGARKAFSFPKEILSPK